MLNSSEYLQSAVRVVALASLQFELEAEFGLVPFRSRSTFTSKGGRFGTSTVIEPSPAERVSDSSASSLSITPLSVSATSCYD